MYLHYRLQRDAKAQHLPVILLHGLFGSMDNLGTLARALQPDYPVVSVDLRNHGLSFHDEKMNYPVMARDVLTLLDQLQIEKAIIIGHSMGGKVAMAMSSIAAARIDKLIIIDIAPVAYQVRRHDSIFAALKAVTAAGITQRQEAAQQMRAFINQNEVIAFLLKSFHQGAWRFNLPALIDQYDNIQGWQQISPFQHPVLFIRAGDSPYLQDVHFDDIARQFPQARAHVITGASHWVHAEKPLVVSNVIRRFLIKNHAS